MRIHSVEPEIWPLEVDLYFHVWDSILPMTCFIDHVIWSVLYNAKQNACKTQTWRQWTRKRGRERKRKRIRKRKRTHRDATLIRIKYRPSNYWFLAILVYYFDSRSIPKYMQWKWLFLEKRPLVYHCMAINILFQISRVCSSVAALDKITRVPVSTMGRNAFAT